MAKKIFLVLIFSAGLFLVASLSKSDVSAQAVTVFVTAKFTNNGNIPLTVWYAYRNKNGYFYGTPWCWVEAVPGCDNPKSVSVPAYSTVYGADVQDTTNAGPPYSVWWATSCTDPHTDANLTQNVGVDYLRYTASADVTCRTTNGEPAITSISCPTPGNTLSFSWQMTGGGPYNVGSYYTFWSQAPDTNPDGNNTDGPWPSSQTSVIMGSRTPGATYYVRVSAVSPQGEWSSPAYSSTTCQSAVAPPAPTNPQKYNVPACSDTNYGGSGNNGGNPPNIKLTFNVTGATGANLQLFRNGVPIEYLDYFPLNSGSSYTLPAWFWNFTPGANYTWRVRADINAVFSTWIDGPGWNVPICSNAPGAPTNLTVSKSSSCTDPPATFNATFNWNTNGGSPTKTHYKLIGTSTIFEETRDLVVTSKTINSIPLYTGYYGFHVRFGNVGSDGGTDWSGWTGLSFAMPVCTESDLLISQLTTDKTDYSPGATVNVTIQIMNNSAATPSTQIWTWYGSDTETRDMANMPICAWDRSYLQPFSVGVYEKMESSMGAEQTITYSGSFTARSTPGTYKIKAIVDGFCQVDEADDSVGVSKTMGANNVKEITYNVASPPTNPGGLSVIKICTTDNLPFVRFSWSINSQNETGYWLDVSTEEWPSAQWGVKTLAANQNRFDWHPLTPLDSGTPLGPGNNTTYWWRLKAFNGVGDSSHVYPDGPDADTASDLSPPGGSFTTLDCRPNLQVTAFTVQTGSPNQTVDATVTVKNVGQGYTFARLTDDPDRDGFTDTEETYMGTNANSVCSATSIADDEAVDALPADFNDDRVVDNADSTLLSAAVSAPYNPRYDLNADGEVDVIDVLFMGSYLGKNCTDFNTFEVAINLFSSTMGCDSVKHATYRASPLGPNASSPPLTIPVTLPATLGTNITAVAMVESKCEVTETVEDDNLRTALYSVGGFDLSASFDSFDKTPASYNAGDTATVTINVTNNGNLPTPASTLVGVWPEGGVLPTCPGSPSVPPVPSPPASSSPYSQTVPALFAGEAKLIQVSFPVGLEAKTPTGRAYVNPNCNIAEYKWDNNRTGDFSFTVIVNSWFETTGGDVGSGGTIDVSLNPLPLGRYQSDYLLVGDPLTSRVRSAKWSITGYDQPLVPGTGGPYAYMAERFLGEAKLNPREEDCDIPSGLREGLNYVDAINTCIDGTAVFQIGGSGPNGNHVIYFIEGNLRIEKNLIIDPEDTLIFIVSGDITVKTSVTRIDGIYIAGGTFTTTDTAGGVSGSQLVVNGAVYGSNVNLTRKLGQGGTCTYNSVTRTIVAGYSCTNLVEPAEVIIFDPKYLIALNTLLGSPGVAWKEVAP